MIDLQLPWKLLLCQVKMYLVSIYIPQDRVDLKQGTMILMEMFLMWLAMLGKNKPSISVMHQKHQQKRNKHSVKKEHILESGAFCF